MTHDDRVKLTLGYGATRHGSNSRWQVNRGLAPSFELAAQIDQERWAKGFDSVIDWSGNDRAEELLEEHVDEQIARVAAEQGVLA